MCPSLVVVALHPRSGGDFTLNHGGFAQPVPGLDPAEVTIGWLGACRSARVDTASSVGRGALSPTAFLLSSVALGPLAFPFPLWLRSGSAGLMGILALGSKCASARFSELTAGKFLLGW